MRGIFSGQVFRGNFFGATFSGQVFSGQVFFGATFSGQLFRGNFFGATFFGATFSGQVFSGQVRLSREKALQALQRKAQVHKKFLRDKRRLVQQVVHVVDVQGQQKEGMKYGVSFLCKQLEEQRL